LIPATEISIAMVNLNSVLFAAGLLVSPLVAASEGKNEHNTEYSSE
jgi:hypothetical protein